VTLERGFRRIVIVLSVLLLGLGLAIDVGTASPHATVQVTLKDGRNFTVERQGSKEYLADRDSLTYALKNGKGEYKGGLKSPVTRQIPREDPRARRAMTENGVYVIYALMESNHEQSSDSCERSNRPYRRHRH
jgi:hypothetical protein